MTTEKVEATEEGVGPETKTKSTWEVCGEQESSEKQGAQLLQEIENTAKCQTRIRSTLIYEEIPGSQVKSSDSWLPIVLAALAILLSGWIQTLAQSEFISQGIVAIFLEAGATAGFGYAGWLVSRGTWGRRLTPLGSTAIKQNLFTVVSLVILVILSSLIPHNIFGSWQAMLVIIFKWLVDLPGSLAELLGWAWWPLLGLAYGFFSGMAIWRTEEKRLTFEEKHPHLHQFSKKVQLKKWASWIFYRVNIGDITCSCARHSPSEV